MEFEVSTHGFCRRICERQLTNAPRLTTNRHRGYITRCSIVHGVGGIVVGCCQWLVWGSFHQVGVIGFPYTAWCLWPLRISPLFVYVVARLAHNRQLLDKALPNCSVLLQALVTSIAAAYINIVKEEDFGDPPGCPEVVTGFLSSPFLRRSINH